MSSNNESNNQPGGPQRGPNPPRTSAISLIIAIALVAYLVYSMVPSMFGAPGTDSIPTSDVVAAVQDDRVSTLTYRVSSGELTGTYWTDGSDKGNDDKLVSFKSTYAGTDNLAELMESHPEVRYTVDTSSDEWLDTLLFSVLPTLLMISVFIYFMRGMQSQGGGAMGFGKTKAKTTEETRPKVKFSDVAGVDEAVEELKEIRDFLAEPERFHKMGAKIPRGVLLVGPPGTGKTLLARAVAGEAGVEFLSISGSDFVEMYVGVGASRVRDLFEQAKKAAPCIIFIDEIDAVGRQRGTGLGGGHDEREQTLNQLLVEMDGFGTNDGVVVLAATNRADILDPALLRPSRFDRQIYVGYPDIKGREDVLKIHTANKPLAEDVDLAKVARGTAGFTGADLENLSNEAALLCARRGDQFITMADFEEAEIKVLAGPEKRSRVVPEHERKLTAYHEAGHAVVMHALPTHEPVHRITIIPRGHAGGMTISLPDEDRSYQSKRYMEEQIVSLLGGRAAEKLMLGDISTGASNDIERASHIARKMVTAYGMSEKLGSIAFESGHDEVFIGKTMGQTRSYSEKTAAEIDDEVKAIIDRAYARCEEILTARREALTAVAEYLLAHETMTGEEFERMVGEKA